MAGYEALTPGCRIAPLAERRGGGSAARAEGLSVFDRFAVILDIA